MLTILCNHGIIKVIVIPKRMSSALKEMERGNMLLLRLYGLRVKGDDELLRWSARRVEDPTDSVDVYFELGKVGVAYWLVADRKMAEAAAQTDTPWYCADYNTPVNPFAGQCEIVELVVAATDGIR